MSNGAKVTIVLFVALLIVLNVIQLTHHNNSLDPDGNTPKLKVCTKVTVGAASNSDGGTVVTRDGHVFKTSTHGKGAAVGSDMILEIEFVKLGSGVWKIYSSELKLSVKGLFEKG